MRIECLFLAKTSDDYLKKGIELYQKRLNRYCKLSLETIQTPAAWRKLPPSEVIQREGELLLKKLETHPNVWLLDENGKEFTSIQFAETLEKQAIHSNSRLAFVVGGAYGLSPQVKERFPNTLSLSQLTFSHQMVRLILLEQLYRAFTIIRGEPYHHA